MKVLLIFISFFKRLHCERMAFEYVRVIRQLITIVCYYRQFAYLNIVRILDKGEVLTEFIDTLFERDL